MKRLQWTLKRWILGLRWPGWAGLALLALALAVYAGGIRPGAARLQSLEREALELTRQSGARAMKAEPLTSRGQLANFYAFFPLAEAVPDILARLEHAARERNLILDKGEYRLSRDPEFRLARYQITLPVRGRYSDVRGFVNDVLDTVPAIALEDLALKRETVDEPELEAQVRFVLYLGAE